ncbi:MAG: hypothetical protein JO011_10525 [Ktedonobacteraceae bacterium]|nr:hypothetical protein [Ktedonobacteraceae bacterium]
MQGHMNRRRFLELSASTPAFIAPGETLDNFSPQISEIAFADTMTKRTDGTQPVNLAKCPQATDQLYDVSSSAQCIRRTIFDQLSDNFNGSVSDHVLAT